jgi:sensor domain CHASE-containing protein
MAAFSQTLREFTGRCKDYSEWDDTYAFVQDGNQEFIASNFTATGLAVINANALLILNAGGATVFATGFDEDKQAMTPVPDGLAANFADASL